MRSTAPRALRVGVLLGDQLVEERVFRAERASPAVTFGQGLRCALSIPGDGVPHEHVLFAHDQGRWRLRVTERMTGRVVDGATVQPALHAGPADQGVWTVAVPLGARGRVQIGEATVLFQELAAPPISPRPVLPAALRDTLADRVDRRLAVIIGGSLVAHLAIAGWAWVTDLPVDPPLAAPIAQTYHHDTLDVVLPDVEPPAPVPATTPAPLPGVAVPARPAQTPAPIVARTPARPAPAMTAADAARLAAIITGADPGRGGPGEMRPRQPGADLRTQIDDVGDRTVTIGDDGKGFRATPAPRVGTDRGPLVDDPTAIATAPRPDREPTTGRITIRPQPPEGPGTTLTVDMVLAKINGVYMAGLQRCYKQGLSGDALLSGRVAMSFTVTPRGAVDEGVARGVGTEVDACIEAQMRSWRFVIPRDADGEATDASFKLALALQPS